MGSLENRNIVIVGGSTGIGLSGARRLRNRGARLGLIGRNSESLEKARAELGSDVECIQGDASDSSVAVRAIDAVVDRWGKLDGLYHVAGGSGRSRGDGPLHEMSDEGLDFTLDLNLKSLIYSNRAAVRRFLEQGNGGVILNTGSVLGQFPSPHYFSTHAYAAAKSAITGFTRSIAAYYAGHNIRANVVAPALVETPMAQRACGNESIMSFTATKQPLDGGRVGMPSDLDGAVELLLSDDSRFLTGQVLYIDGGWSVSDGQIAVQSSQ